MYKITKFLHKILPFTVIIDFMRHLKEQVRLQTLVRAINMVTVITWTLTRLYLCSGGLKIAETIFPNQYPDKQLISITRIKAIIYEIRWG